MNCLNQEECDSPVAVFVGGSSCFLSDHFSNSDIVDMISRDRDFQRIVSKKGHYTIPENEIVQYITSDSDISFAFSRVLEKNFTRSELVDMMMTRMSFSSVYVDEVSSQRNMPSVKFLDEHGSFSSSIINRLCHSLACGSSAHSVDLPDTLSQEGIFSFSGNAFENKQYGAILLRAYIHDPETPNRHPCCSVLRLVDKFHDFCVTVARRGSSEELWNTIRDGYHRTGFGSSVREILLELSGEVKDGYRNHDGSIRPEFVPFESVPIKYNETHVLLSKNSCARADNW